MPSKNQIQSNGKALFPFPSARFVTDFTRLITDVDRLIVDISSIAEKQKASSATNGTHRRLRSDTIPTLREHARSFFESLTTFGVPIERLPVPYLELDSSVRIIRTNQACAKMLNRDSTFLAGKSLFTFIAGSDIRRFRAELADLRSGEPGLVSLTIVHQGKCCPAELHIRRHIVGREIGYVAVIDAQGYFQNKQSSMVSMSKDGSVSLHDLFMHLSSAHTIDALRDVVRNYCITAFNSPAGMIFVESRGNLELAAQWRGKHIPKRYLNEHVVTTGPAAYAFRSGKPVFSYRRKTHCSPSHYLVRLLPRSDGGTANFLPVGEPGQRPLGVMAVVLSDGQEPSPLVRDDMHRLAQLVSSWLLRAREHKEILEARTRAEETVKTQEEFLSALSHELKHPMTPILGWAIALSSGSLPTERQNLALEGIIRNVRTLNYLVEDMFDVVRISSGKLRLDLSEVRIQEIAREALMLIESSMESKKLRISTEISEAVPTFFADPRRIRQVLVNLLNNAVKFTPPGGGISLRILKQGNNVDCVVSDTGKGIARKFLPFVFDKFRQENRYAKARGAGLGLGLAIAREIAALHGGTIKAFSKGVDKGATFSLRLPLRREEHNKRPAVSSRGT